MLISLIKMSRVFISSERALMIPANHSPTTRMHLITDAHKDKDRIDLHTLLDG